MVIQVRVTVTKVDWEWQGWEEWSSDLGERGFSYISFGRMAIATIIYN